MSRTSLPRWAISAIPPALSVIGPNASIATTIPAIDNIDTAATATPYKPPDAAPPQIQEPEWIAPPLTPPGQAGDSFPTASPAMMFVAWPVSLALAMDFTGA